MKSQANRTKRAPKKRTRSTPDWAPRFLVKFEHRGNITTACAAAGISRHAFYLRRASDAEFAEAVRLANQTATEVLEAEAWRRAHDGTERPIFGSGGTGVGSVQVGTVRDYSDTLLIFLLKARAPKKYRERIDLKHRGGLKVRHTGSDLSRLTDDQLDQLEALLAAAEAPAQPGRGTGGEGPAPAG